MKNKLLLILLAVALAPALCFGQTDNSLIGTIDFLEQKKGYKNIVLGDSLASITGKIEETRSYDVITNGVTYYKLNDESLLKVGDDVIIQAVKVGIYHGRIARIILELEGINGLNLLSVFKQAYGNLCFEPNRFIENYSWYSTSYNLNINLSMRDLQLATFAHSKLNKEIIEFEREQTKKAASGL